MARHVVGQRGQRHVRWRLAAAANMTESLIPAPADMTYLAVSLKDGERWRYAPPAGHTVAWLAVSDGRIAL